MSSFDNKNLTRKSYAFRFNDSSETSLATSYLFPNEFPTDFSILIVARQMPGCTYCNSEKFIYHQFLTDQLSSIFALYNVEGEEQIVVNLGKQVNLFYRDSQEFPADGNSIPFDVIVDDGM